MGLEPWADDRPLAFQTGEWWRTDPGFADPRDDGYAISPIDVRQFVLAMGLDGAVPMYTILGQALELTDNVFLVPNTTLDALDQMLRTDEIAAVHDQREPGGRWAGPTALLANRLAELLSDDGPAMGPMIPGLEAYEILKGISVETSTSTRAEAEVWVAANRRLWDMVLTEFGHPTGDQDEPPIEVRATVSQEVDQTTRDAIGEEATLVSFDDQTRIVLSGGWELILRGQATWTHGSNEPAVFHADEPRAVAAELVSLRGRLLTELMIDAETSVVTATFGDRRLRAGPDDSDENWQLNGPDGIKILALPGGGEPAVSGRRAQKPANGFAR